MWNDPAYLGQFAKRKVEIEKIPPCDFCLREGKRWKAVVDGLTAYGAWANMCLIHFGEFGVGLGLGRGQELMTKGDPLREKVDDLQRAGNDRL